MPPKCDGNQSGHPTGNHAAPRAPAHGIPQLQAERAGCDQQTHGTEQGTKPPTQNNRGVLPTCSLHKRCQLRGTVLGTCNSPQPSRFNHHSCNATKEVRHMGLLAQMVHEFQLECLQEFQPTHLATGQLMLCLQILERFMVGDNTCALAVNVMAPFLNGDNNGHQSTFMGGVI